MTRDAAPDDLKAALTRAGQDHLVEHQPTVPPERLKAYLTELQALDLPLLMELIGCEEAPEPQARARLQPVPMVVPGEDPGADAEARALGEGLLRSGAVAAFTVAGGQGTRLGHPGPKGTFPCTPIRGRSLFEVFAKKIRRLGRRYGTSVPWYLMTSPGNHDETVEFFAERQWFGLPPSEVRFFPQGTMPAVDRDGRVLLASPGRLFQSPDGHGGALKGLRVSGALDELAHRGVSVLFYFQVDNPLVEMCDPLFLGHHTRLRSEFSSKAVPKRDPGEKVGVFVLRDGKPGIIEYSDLPSELRESRDDEGDLLFRAGNIAVHAIDVNFVRKLTDGRFSLPYHRAAKPIPAWDPSGEIRDVPGTKFETFVFDALPLASAFLVQEARRTHEFSPIKNAEGSDSPITAAADQTALFAEWLEAAGVVVPRDAQGKPIHRIEIDPCFADGPDDLCRRRSELPDRVIADLTLDEVLPGP